MDGLEMARILREQKKNIPILILSGYDEFDYARTAVRLNISDYLLKPIDEEELSAALSLMAIQAASNQREQGISISMQASAKNGLVQKAQEYILTHYADPISLTSVAEELGVTAAYLSTVFHREMGSSYSQTLLRIRMENAAALLSDTQLKVREIAQAVGFPSAKHFTYVFGQYFHCSPVEFRNRKESMPL